MDVMSRSAQSGGGVGGGARARPVPTVRVVVVVVVVVVLDPPILQDASTLSLAASRLPCSVKIARRGSQPRGEPYPNPQQVAFFRKDSPSGNNAPKGIRQNGSVPSEEAVAREGGDEGVWGGGGCSARRGAA